MVVVELFQMVLRYTQQLMQVVTLVGLRKLIYKATVYCLEGNDITFKRLG